MQEWKPDETLGDRIRVGRARKRYTLRKAAELVGKAPSYLSDIENGRRTPSEDALADLARVLELDLDDLMAAAGRIGERADKYIRRTPEAGLLMRRLSDRNISREGLRKLIAQVPTLPKKPGEADR